MKKITCDKCKKELQEDENFMLFWEKDDGSCELHKIGDYCSKCLKKMGMKK